MNILLTYICAIPYHDNTAYATRFLTSYRRFDSGYPHSVVVVVNGGEMDESLKNLFMAQIPCIIVPGTNIGQDIGSYIMIAKENEKWGADAMFLCGSSTHFRRAGWLKRMADVWEKNGPGYYGSMASNEVRPHIRTAAGVLIDPKLLASYPFPVRDRSERYNFEHGIPSMGWWAKENGCTPLVVAWDREYEEHEWGAIPEGYRSGKQTNALAYDSVSDRFDEGV